MNLQRISEFAEIQEGKGIFYYLYGQNYYALYKGRELHPEVFTQIYPANCVILDDLIGLTFR